jgi:hypothetical protein
MKKLRIHAAIAAFAWALTACEAPPTQLPRPADGYAAIRFKEEVRVRQRAGHIRFPAGTVLIGDHMTSDGVLAYCGTVLHEAAIGGRDLMFR